MDVIIDFSSVSCISADSTAPVAIFVSLIIMLLIVNPSFWADHRSTLLILSPSGRPQNWI